MRKAKEKRRVVSKRNKIKMMKLKKKGENKK